MIHDLSKYGPSEAPHYGRQFFGDKSDPDRFARAWLHHQNVNPHHWEYWISRTWISRTGHDRVSHLKGSLRMPLWAVREMVADWMGASRSYSGSWPVDWAGWVWMRENLRSKILPRVHPETRQDILDVMSEVLGRCHSCHGNGYATDAHGSFLYELDCPHCIGEPYLRQCNEGPAATTVAA